MLMMKCCCYYSRTYFPLLLIYVSLDSSSEGHFPLEWPENSSVSHLRLAALFLLHSTNTKMRILQYFISRTTFLHSFNIPGAISQDAITLVIRVKSAVQTAYNFLCVASYLFYEISTQRWETPHVI